MCFSELHVAQRVCQKTSTNDEIQQVLGVVYIYTYTYIARYSTIMNATSRQQAFPVLMDRFRFVLKSVLLVNRVQHITLGNQDIINDHNSHFVASQATTRLQTHVRPIIIQVQVRPQCMQSKSVSGYLPQQFIHFLYVERDAVVFLGLCMFMLV